MHQSWTPHKLAEVIGQPVPTRTLQTFAMEPYPSKWLLEGPPGVGKTCSALALAHELGVKDIVLTQVSATDLDMDQCHKLFNGQFRLRLPPEWGRWQFLLIEELERLPNDGKAVVPYLKDRLSEQWYDEHYGSLIVVATSNDASGIDPALLDRFTVLPYSGGPEFGRACQERLPSLWRSAVPARWAGRTLLPYAQMPPNWTQWGWRGESFSMRRALRAMHQCLRGMLAPQIAEVQ